MPRLNGAGKSSWTREIRSVPARAARPARPNATVRPRTDRGTHPPAARRRAAAPTPGDVPAVILESLFGPIRQFGVHGASAPALEPARVSGRTHASALAGAGTRARVGPAIRPSRTGRRTSAPSAAVQRRLGAPPRRLRVPRLRAVLIRLPGLLPPLLGEPAERLLAGLATVGHVVRLVRMHSVLGRFPPRPWDMWIPPRGPDRPVPARMAALSPYGPRSPTFDTMMTRSYEFAGPSGYGPHRRAGHRRPGGPVVPASPHDLAAGGERHQPSRTGETGCPGPRSMPVWLAVAEPDPRPDHTIFDEPSFSPD
jgi:hypothetical protein